MSCNNATQNLVVGVNYIHNGFQSITRYSCAPDLLSIYSFIPYIAGSSSWILECVFAFCSACSTQESITKYTLQILEQRILRGSKVYHNDYNNPKYSGFSVIAVSQLPVGQGSKRSTQGTKVRSILENLIFLYGKLSHVMSRQHSE